MSGDSARITLELERFGVVMYDNEIKEAFRSLTALHTMGFVGFSEKDKYILLAAVQVLSEHQQQPKKVSVQELIGIEPDFKWGYEVHPTVRNLADHGHKADAVRLQRMISFMTLARTFLIDQRVIT